MFFAAERVTFLTDFLTSIFSILLHEEIFFVSLSLSYNSLSFAFFVLLRVNLRFRDG